MKEICLFILITTPIYKLGITVAKEMKEEKDPSPGIVAAIIYIGLWYVVYYVSGVFTLLK